MTDGSADAFVLPSSFPDGVTPRLSLRRHHHVVNAEGRFQSDATQKYMKAPGSGKVDIRCQRPFSLKV